MYYIFKIHLLVDGHLHSFQFGAITNNAVVNIYLYMSLCKHMLSLLLSKHLGMKWLAHMVNVT